jgi:thioredoxin-like negative regulator of GroEL
VAVSTHPFVALTRNTSEIFILNALPSMASEALVTLTAENFQSEIESATSPVIVDFWAE